MSTPQDRIYALLTELVAQTEIWTRTRPECLRNTWTKPLAFAKEWRTVRFGSARQIGHTTAGIRLAHESKCPTLFLTLRPDMLHHLQGLAKYMDPAPHVQIATVKTEKWRRGTYGLVIVDCARFSHGDEDKVYSLARDIENCPLFVLLE